MLLSRQYLQCFDFCRHADVMKKIIQMVADGGGDLGVHVYPWLHEGVGDFEVSVMVVGEGKRFCNVGKEWGIWKFHMCP